MLIINNQYISGLNKAINSVERVLTIHECYSNFAVKVTSTHSSLKLFSGEKLENIFRNSEEAFLYYATGSKLRTR